MIIKRIRIALSVSPRIACAIIFGICAIVRNAANTVEKPTINVVAPLTTMASLNDLYAPLTSSSLYTNTPTMKEYTTEITAASVGEKKPE